MEAWEGQDFQDELTFEEVDCAQRRSRTARTGGNHYFFRCGGPPEPWTRGARSAGCRSLRFARRPSHACRPSLQASPRSSPLRFSLPGSGYARAGLLAVLLLALHPWHIRYSTEARGYTLMLLFFILTVWALMAGRPRDEPLRRHWLLFALASFLAAWSWKLAVIPATGGRCRVPDAAGATALPVRPRRGRWPSSAGWWLGSRPGPCFVFLVGPGLAPDPPM